MPIEYSKDQNGTIVCRFETTMDTDLCNEAEKVIASKLTGDSPVIFDMNGVIYISSSFLRICAKVSSKTGRDRFSIINVSEPVQKLFKIAGCGKLLNVKP